jgi:hypothetical protein
MTGKERVIRFDTTGGNELYLPREDEHTDATKSVSPPVQITDTGRDSAALREHARNEWRRHLARGTAR